MLSPGAWFKSLQTQLRAAHHRQCVVLHGDIAWQIHFLSQLDQTGIWFGDTSPIARFIPHTLAQLKHSLGQTIPHAVFSAEQGIDADALGLASGMIGAGGCLWILLPNNWPNTANPANQRFLSFPDSYHQAWLGFNGHLNRALQSTLNPAIWLNQTQPLPVLSAPVIESSQPHEPTDTPNAPLLNGLTADQQQGLAKIQQLAFGHRHRPLLISADRGRGKSALLGLAAADLLQQGKQTVLLCAARYDQTATAFAHAEQVLQPATTRPGWIEWQNKTIQFCAPDALIQQPIAADLLMIDEAAQLPNPILEQLLNLYPRVVLATTLHGYEGCGRGFSLRFMPYLSRQFPAWQQCHLSQPIRWAPNDPLEALIEQALLYNADLPDYQSCDSQPTDSPLRIEKRTPHSLPPDTLKQVFTLLVNAHYQTSPADLQQLLSAPGLSLFLAYQADQLVGALLTLNEGGLPPLPASRRVKGHLVPQLVRLHSGDSAILAAQSERAMRLAVHPQAQHRGFGTQLVRFWLDHSQTDFCSASFGLTEPLYAFWRKLGFSCVHLGSKLDKASASRNGVMVYTRAFDFSRIQQHYARQLVHQIMENPQGLAPGLVIALLSEIAPPSPYNQTWLLDYADNLRPYEAICGDLWHWTHTHAAELGVFSPQQQAIWLDKVLLKQDWATVANHHGLAGRKGVENELKRLIKQWLD